MFLLKAEVIFHRTWPYCVTEYLELQATEDTQLYTQENQRQITLQYYESFPRYK